MGESTGIRLGQKVSFVISPHTTGQVIAIISYLDGGYKYTVTYHTEDDYAIREGNFFEEELTVME